MTSYSPYSVPITDFNEEGLTHQVYDQNIHRHSAGQPLPAVCGVMILPAPMASPVGKPCQECEIRISYLAWDCPPPQATALGLVPHPFRMLRRYLIHDSKRRRRPPSGRSNLPGHTDGQSANLSPAGKSWSIRGDEEVLHSPGSQKSSWTSNRREIAQQSPVPVPPHHGPTRQASVRLSELTSH
jgi:hypothetical protein